jgi:hypothetical protein
VLDHIQE